MRFRPALLAFAIAATLSSSVGAFTNERGLDKRNFDTSVSPCADFYQYANGGWMKSNPIPAAYSTWGISNEMRDRNLELLKQILEETAREKAAPGSNAQKIGDFYASAMDEAAIEKAGYDPIRKDLAKIDAAKSTADIVKLVRDYHAE